MQLGVSESLKSKRYFVYKLVMRNPSKPPLLIATYLTCDCSTASVTYFLQAFQTDLTKMYGNKANKRPVMIICDGSLALLMIDFFNILPSKSRGSTADVTSKSKWTTSHRKV